MSVHTGMPVCPCAATVFTLGRSDLCESDLGSMWLHWLNHEAGSVLATGVRVRHLPFWRGAESSRAHAAHRSSPLPTFPVDPWT